LKLTLNLGFDPEKEERLVDVLAYRDVHRE